jgi:hypothetical protein
VLTFKASQILKQALNQRGIPSMQNGSGSGVTMTANSGDTNVAKG